MRELDTLLGPLERANLKHWTRLRLGSTKRLNKAGVSLPSPEDGNRSSFGKVVCFLIFRIPEEEQSL
jgi:hypothetical protein